MKNLQTLAEEKIAELVANGINTVATEKGGEVWGSTDVEGDFLHIFAEPVQASFTKKENKELVPYSGYAYAVKMAATGTDKNEAVKYNQIILGVFSKVGSEETAELEVRRTKLTSEEGAFKRVPTKVLINGPEPEKPAKEKKAKKTKKAEAAEEGAE